MQILKTTQTYLPYLDKGGPPVKVSGIAKALAARGHEVTVLTADLGALNGHTPLQGWQRHASEWGWESQHDGVLAIYLKSIGRYRAATINPKVLSFCTARLADYQVVHVYGLYDTIGAAVAWFCRRRGIPYVLEPLGMFGPKVRSQRKKQIYGRLMGDALFRGAAKVIATSETEHVELHEGGVAKEKLFLRRNGLDLSSFANLPARGAFRERLGLGETPLVLFVGRLSFIKGLDLLVQAFAQVPGDATLVLAGPDDDDGCLKQVSALIEQHSLQGRVVLSPPLYGTEKLEALVDSDLFVLPSRYESFGNAAAEAMACGIPVLVTSECGIAPLVDNRAGLVVSCEVNALRDGLRELLVNEGLRQRFSEGCSVVASGLSWDEPVEAMEAEYEKCLR